MKKVSIRLRPGKKLAETYGASFVEGPVISLTNLVTSIVTDIHRYSFINKAAISIVSMWVEASAYDGANVEQAFLKLTEQIVTKKGGVPAEDGGMKDKLMNSRPGKQISKKCCKT